MRNPWQRFIEALLPWYSPELEHERDERSERIRRDAIAARMKAEQVREAYRQAGARLDGRR